MPLVIHPNALSGQLLLHSLVCDAIHTMWVPWSFLHPLCCEVRPLVECYCMWESLFVGLQYISHWIGMLFEALQRERANQYLQYLYVPVKINTGPSRMKGVQRGWLAISGQLLSLRNSAILRSQQWFLWLPGWTFRDVCSLTKWKPIGPMHGFHLCHYGYSVYVPIVSVLG